MVINVILSVCVFFLIYFNHKNKKRADLLEMENRRIIRENQGRPIKHCKCKRV